MMMVEYRSVFGVVVILVGIMMRLVLLRVRAMKLALAWLCGSFRH